jgi:hypothetical protein
MVYSRRRQTCLVCTYLPLAKPVDSLVLDLRRDEKGLFVPHDIEGHLGRITYHPGLSHDRSTLLRRMPHCTAARRAFVGSTPIQHEVPAISRHGVYHMWPGPLASNVYTTTKKAYQYPLLPREPVDRSIFDICHDVKTLSPLPPARYGRKSQTDYPPPKPIPQQSATLTTSASSHIDIRRKSPRTIKPHTFQNLAPARAQKGHQCQRPQGLRTPVS